jgi:pimeloyl-ACP methyl ester carboxylesterase
MPNSRGNVYSRGNRRYRSTDFGYWDNSMDELALLDRPAQIDFVLNFTGLPSVGTVGHSQGCTLTVMLLAMRPEYINKIWMLMLMGPVTHSEYIQTPFLKQQAKTESAQILLASAGVGEFLPQYSTSQMISGCAIPANTKFCFDLINFMVSFAQQLAV